MYASLGFPTYNLCSAKVKLTHSVAIAVTGRPPHNAMHNKGL